MKLRKAAIHEIEELMALRKLQLIDEGLEPDIDIDAELRDFFQKQMETENLIEWVAEADGQIVATAAIMFLALPPSFSNKSGRRGYITNMYTKEAYRKKGIALKLLARLKEEAEIAGVPVILLGASDMGRPFYEKFGFRPAETWMELYIRDIK